ncbi:MULTISPECIES: LutC/YkgG family protein [unclassified Cytobacillus]|uniref:LutC/YkgG family protein n=1 Tax=unclassified Cytobacillus TaxID=2675268 RepID=UPI001356EF8B|nr:lactate utilization protein C [Cytobacillus sp. AMY 15.2]KAF0816176.1 Lactate utilization protein LutC [Bacillus sp. ZZV12-4809]MCM3090284.1 lactate utilization protein C [Cytobacillus sp. AMY 15.2]
MKGTIQNRDAFITKIAGRLGREKRTFGVEKPKWSYNPQDAIFREADADELLEALKTQCTKIHTDLLVTKAADLPETLKRITAEYGGGPIVTWKDDRFRQFGLTQLFEEIWPKENVKVYEWDYSAENKNIEYAEQANIGITISEITLAESGTAVLFSSRDHGRAVSFLPAASIILIPKTTLVPRMTQAARIIRERVKSGELAPSCINFITGPSNSADIEMNLVVGVHGPVKAAYIVIDDL